MIEAAASFLLSNAISIHNVGGQIHIKTPIALFHLQQPLYNYQLYLIVRKCLEASVPSMLTVPSNQVFFCGQMTIYPKSNQPTITVEEDAWIVHQGQSTNLYAYENAHVWGKARVLNTLWHPWKECVAMIDIVELKKNQVSNSFRFVLKSIGPLFQQPGSVFRDSDILELPCIWVSLNPVSSRYPHQTTKSLTRFS